MAKITLDSIVSGFGSTTKFNSNFDAIEAEFQNKVLYRDNPTGEPNQMETNLDMNSNDILNVRNINTSAIVVGGVPIQNTTTTYSGVVEETFVATEGQTVFNLATPYTQYLNNIQVYVNGLREEDFTETSTTSITFTDPLKAGDEVTTRILSVDTLDAVTTATNVSYIPAGPDVVSTNVQEAITELDTNKASVNTTNSFSELQTIADLTVTGTSIAPTIGPDSDSQHTLPNVAADTFTLNNATQILTNKQIKFPVIQNPTSDATTLDDWRSHSTWNAVLSDAATGGNTATVTATIARYYKIGEWVTVTCNFINIVTTGMTAGNQLFVQGLPFATNTQTNERFVTTPIMSSSTTVTNYLQGYTTSAATYITLLDMGAAMLVSQLTSGAADLYFTLTYRAAS